MTQLDLFGDNQPPKKPKSPKAKTAYSSPTYILVVPIIDRSVTVNFNATFLKVSLISVALYIGASPPPATMMPRLFCETVAGDTQWPSITCRDSLPN